MKPLTRTVSYFNCAHCHVGEFTVDHLDGFPAHDYAWRCRNCGRYTDFRYDPETRELDILGVKEWPKPALVVLELRPGELTKPLRLVVEYSKCRSENEGEAAQYYFEEHTCPINIVRATQAVIYGNDSDMHGIFRYVGQVEVPSRDHEKVSEFVAQLCNDLRADADPTPTTSADENPT